MAVIDTMNQSLRIKEESYSNMFNERVNTVRETKASLEKAQR